MPAFDLAVQKATLSRFDVVGKYSETSPRFVKHVALLNTDNGEVKYGEKVAVVHMGPPLETGGRLNAHVAGSIPLTNDQVKSIETWIAKEEEEYREANAKKFEQYVIKPPWKDFRDPKTGVRRFRRYSCAGFVLYAYRQVGVLLLVRDQETLPEVTRKTIETAYPKQSRRAGLLAKSGLDGDGPWRVVLAGYVLHALDRTREDIGEKPYVPKKGDEFFGSAPR